MALTLTFNGVDYVIPTTRETGWGAALNAFLQALAEGAAGSADVATLQAEIDALETAVGAPTNSPTPSTIVKRDASGGAGFAGTLSASVASIASLNVQEFVGILQGDTTGTVGDDTSDTPSGRSTIGSGSLSTTITNSLVTESSIVLHVMQTNVSGSGCHIESVVPFAGGFTVTLDKAATSLFTFGWVVINPPA